MWKITHNNSSIPTCDIPCFSMDIAREEIIAQIKRGMRPVFFFGNKDKDTVRAYIVLADDDQSQVMVSSVDLGIPGQEYPSLTADFPQMCMFERELYEDYGVIPAGHPWLKPVRFSFNRFNPLMSMGNYPFFSVEGEGVHEVAVGPVHAGIIEPGHFRFMCHAEDVFHLEIQLGYQHRGIEQLVALHHGKPKIHLAESIAGDTVIGHSLAYSQVIESCADADISRRSDSIRAVALEMERIAMHIGDLSALSGDVAYLLGNAVFGAIRTQVINTTLALCGSRFGRGLIREGGVVYDIDASMRAGIMHVLDNVEERAVLMAEKMFSTPSVLARFEQAGVVDKETARLIGLVGMAARASGIPRDARTTHPSGAYRFYPIHTIVMESGDVFARGYLRYAEIRQSIKFIRDLL
ncbi:MAG: NADH-quinone oxidoreductase subunit C, partial [Candidatus Omnitrophica bacterium]|nr:NADH-quinone oxidoreductase subunit C [Candidatus Omnitrophota bacterium]